MVKWVKPTGDMTPVRPDVAEGLGFPAPTTKRDGGGISVKLGVPRVFLCGWDGLRRPELAGTELAAVVEVRVWTGSMLRGTRE